MTQEETTNIVKAFNLPKTLCYGGYHPQLKCWSYIEVPIEDALNGYKECKSKGGIPYIMPLIKSKVKRNGQWWVR